MSSNVIDLRITSDALKDGIELALVDLIVKASDDLKRRVKTEVDWIAKQASELGIAALDGDEVAMRKLDDMCLHAIQDQETITIKEKDRLSGIAKLIASMSIKVLVGTKGVRVKK